MLSKRARALSWYRLIHNPLAIRHISTDPRVALAEIQLLTVARHGHPTFERRVAGEPSGQLPYAAAPLREAAKEERLTSHSILF